MPDETQNIEEMSDPDAISTHTHTQNLRLILTYTDNDFLVRISIHIFTIEYHITKICTHPLCTRERIRDRPSISDLWSLISGKKISPRRLGPQIFAANTLEVCFNTQVLWKDSHHRNNLLYLFTYRWSFQFFRQMSEIFDRSIWYNLVWHKNKFFLIYWREMLRQCQEICIDQRLI